MPPKKYIIEKVDAKLLESIAKKFNINSLEASLLLDKCVQKTAASHNISYAVVYNLILIQSADESISIIDNLMPKSITINKIPVILQKSITQPKSINGSLKACDKFNSTECQESDRCFNLESYGCVDREIPNVQEINDNPDKYIAKYLGRTEDLKRMVKLASYIHYNYGGELSDNAFDALEYHLKKKEKIKGRAYDKIGALPVDKIRVRLTYPMPSLEKVKPGTNEFTKYLNQFVGNAYSKPSACCWSLKLDGVSGMIIYEKGKISIINTRGDGLTGGNVTYLRDYIKTIPNIIDRTTRFVVKGEFIITKDKWLKKYQGSYSNARAFVAGKINSGYISTALHDIDFIAYGIIDDLSTPGIVPQPSKAFKILESLNFKVNDNGTLMMPTMFEIIELYKSKRLSSECYIDGIVLAIDKQQSSTPQLKNEVTSIMSPTYMIAFKMQLEEQIRSTKAIDVEWNISRYGRYSPVVIYEAVYVDGVRMTRATGHNAKHIVDWNMGKGTKIKIIRQGDVLPVIKDITIDNKIVPIMPKTFDNGGYEWHFEKSDIFLDKIEGNREVMIKRLVHFFDTVNVPGLKGKTAEKLYDAGLTTPESIVKATISEMIKIKGIGKVTATKFYDTIRKNMTEIPPDRFIEASTTFKSGIGRKLLKQLFRYIPDILDMKEEQIVKYLKTTKIPGFGPARIESISKGIPEFKKYLDSFAKDIVKKSISHYKQLLKNIEKNGKNSLIDGKQFVTTGFMGNLDYEIEDYIYNHNGDFVSTVTSSVSAVIVGSVLEFSKKMAAAAELNIQVLSLEEFCDRFNVPIKKFTKIEKDEDD